MSESLEPGTLSSYPDILAAASDITAYLGHPVLDKCLSATAVGSIEASETGCGLVVARDGVRIDYDANDPRGTFVANGRNILFVRTHFEDITRSAADVYHTSLLSLRVLTQSSDQNKLCDDAVVIREQYVDGIEEISLDGLPDPDDPYNPATLCAIH